MVVGSVFQVKDSLIELSASAPYPFKIVFSKKNKMLYNSEDYWTDMRMLGGEGTNNSRFDHHIGLDNFVHQHGIMN